MVRRRKRLSHAGVRVNGRKRRIMTHTLGLLLFAVIHPAGIQDRDGAPDVFPSIRNRFPWLRHVFANGGYAGDKLKAKLRGRVDGSSSEHSHGPGDATGWQSNGSDRWKVQRP